MVLPHELLPWLKRNNAFPQVFAAELSKYWHHFQSLGIDWAAASKDLEETLHPVYLWGDDVQYNESYEKLIVICMGHCLDKRTFSLETCWPIITIREVPLQESSCFFCIVLVDSIFPNYPWYLNVHICINQRYLALVSQLYMLCSNQQLGQIQNKPCGGRPYRLHSPCAHIGLITELR